MTVPPPEPEPPMKTTACTSQEAKLVTTLTGHTGRVSKLVFSPDRSLLASTADDATACLWATAGGLPGPRAVLNKGEPLRALAFAPNSRTLAVGSAAPNGLVWLFDVTDRQPLPVATLRGPRGAVEALAFSADGKLLAGGGEDNVLRVWDVTANTAGNARAILPGHSRPITRLAFAPDGQSVATAAGDGTVRLWTIGRIWSKQKAVLPHPGGATALAFSPDGKLLATATGDHRLRLWDLTGLQPRLQAELPGHTTPVGLTHFAPDGRTLVSVADGPILYHWELLSSTRTAIWTVPTVEATGLALTGDARYLAVGTAAGPVAIYRVAAKR